MPIDFNQNGYLDAEDIEIKNFLLELELREEKAQSQKKMAWISILSMIIFTALLFTPIISENRVNALAELIGLFYLAQAGVVGAYMGATAWMSKPDVKPSRFSSANYSRKVPLEEHKEV
jgi:hypothetical protein